MTQSFASGITLYLAKKLTPGGTVTLTENPGVDQGRLFFKNNFQVEWLEFTSVTLSGGFYVLGGVTRDIDQYAIPATSNSNGKTWLATQSCVLVQMHDQMIDRTLPTQLVQEALTFATTADRDTDLGGDGVATFAYTDVYVVSTGLFYNYNLSSNQWEAVDTGTVTPNASETVAGKVEIATTAQSKTGTDTGETGATLSVKPSDIAKNTQSGIFQYGEDSESNDAYVVTLTPALTSYTTGQTITFKPNTTNTGACTIDIDGLGVKDIKLIDGTDPLDGDIVADRLYDLKYDGTNFVLQQVPQRATSVETLAKTNILNYITPAGLGEGIQDSIGTQLTRNFNQDYTESVAGFVTCYALPFDGGSSSISILLAGTQIGRYATSASAGRLGANLTIPIPKGVTWRANHDTLSSFERILVFFPNK